MPSGPCSVGHAQRAMLSGPCSAGRVLSGPCSAGPDRAVAAGGARRGDGNEPGIEAAPRHPPVAAAMARWQGVPLLGGQIVGRGGNHRRLLVVEGPEELAPKLLGVGTPDGGTKTVDRCTGRRRRELEPQIQVDRFVAGRATSEQGRGRPPCGPAPKMEPHRHLSQPVRHACRMGAVGLAGSLYPGRPAAAVVGNSYAAVHCAWRPLVEKDSDSGRLPFTRPPPPATVVARTGGPCGRSRPSTSASTTAPRDGRARSPARCRTASSRPSAVRESRRRCVEP